MPRLVKAVGGAWKTVQIPLGEKAKSADWEFLGGLEELSPDEFAGDGDRVRNKKRMGKKKKKNESENGDMKTKGLDAEVGPPTETLASVPRKKARKRNDKSAVSRSAVKRPRLTEERSSTAESAKGVDGANSETTEQNPSSALIDMSAWSDLRVPEVVLRALRDLNFTQPTAVQKLVLPHAIKDRLDILGAAETGSGKTLAFGIPLVARLLESANEERRPLRALVMTPTRELALQVKDHIAAILKYTTLKVTAIVGGLNQQKQERIMKRCPEIIVATPVRSPR